MTNPPVKSAEIQLFYMFQTKEGYSIEAPENIRTPSMIDLMVRGYPEEDCGNPDGGWDGLMEVSVNYNDKNEKFIHELMSDIESMLGRVLGQEHVFTEVVEPS